MEALRQSMADILKDKNEDKRPQWFGCETCHIWKKEAITLKSKVDKVLQSKVTFVIDTLKYDIYSHNPYRRYIYVEKSSNGKSIFSHNGYCHYYCMKAHIISK